MIKEKDMVRFIKNIMTLEELIQKLIAENTDPFTTDADIRFFETEKWMAKNSSWQTFLSVVLLR